MKAFVLGGGFMVVETTAHLITYLKEMGFDVFDTEDAEDFLSQDFEACDLLVLNSCLWTGSGNTISEGARKALMEHFEKGKGVVVMHSSIGNWDDWPGYIELIGAIWHWEKSKHSDPNYPFTIVKTEDHPLLENVPDSFEVIDEMYYDLEFTDGNHVIARSADKDGGHPMVWYRQYGKSIVPAIMIGHDERAVTHPQYIQLFKNACQWTLRGKTNE